MVATTFRILAGLGLALGLINAIQLTLFFVMISVSLLDVSGPPLGVSSPLFALFGIFLEMLSFRFQRLWPFFSSVSFEARFGVDLGEE